MRKRVRALSFECREFGPDNVRGGRTPQASHWASYAVTAWLQGICAAPRVPRLKPLTVGCRRRTEQNCKAAASACVGQGAMAEGGAMRATKKVKEMLLELKHSFWLPPFSVRTLCRRCRPAPLPLCGSRLASLAASRSLCSVESSYSPSFLLLAFRPTAFALPSRP